MKRIGERYALAAGARLTVPVVTLTPDRLVDVFIVIDVTEFSFMSRMELTAVVSCDAAGKAAFPHVVDQGSAPGAVFELVGARDLVLVLRAPERHDAIFWIDGGVYEVP